MFARVMDIFKQVDFATAGWKTYSGLAIAAVGLGLLATAKVTPEQGEAVVGVGLAIAGLGKLASDKRETKL